MANGSDEIVVVRFHATLEALYIHIRVLCLLQMTVNLLCYFKQKGLKRGEGRKTDKIGGTRGNRGDESYDGTLF